MHLFYNSIVYSIECLDARRHLSVLVIVISKAITNCDCISVIAFSFDITAVDAIAQATLTADAFLGFVIMIILL